MLGRVYADAARRAFGQVKMHAHRAYNTARKMANGFDEAIRIGGRIYHAAKPLLDDIAQATGQERALGQASRRAAKGYDDYETLRSQVTGAHDKVMHTAGKVKRALGPGVDIGI